MPCIKTTTSVPVSDAQRKALQARFGKAIEIFPGKSERWLMLVTEDSKNISLAGDDTTPAAWVELSLVGKSDRTHFERMTAEICTILEEVLSIRPDRVYVKYEEVEHWGWNGGNF